MKSTCISRHIGSGLLLLLFTTMGASLDAVPPRQVTLNRLTFTIDTDTGGIIKLHHPDVGTLLETTPDQAGLLDMAYPIARFEPLRLATRFSSDTLIEATEDQLVIHWDHLGMNRDKWSIEGDVSATVTLTTLDDGESVAARCRVENNSQKAIPQVLFPDLWGFLPFAGREHTRFRTGGYSSLPFIELQRQELGTIFYVNPDGYGYAEAASGGFYPRQMLMRWFDLGSLKGGMSMCQKGWSWLPEQNVHKGLCKVTMRKFEFQDKLRLNWEHRPVISPGQTWESFEHVLTPHKYGWAKGVGPYKAFVREKIASVRQYPIPDHIKQSLGYRSVWLCTAYPADGEDDIVWHLCDLPKIAAESRKYCLNEMVLWFWSKAFQAPIPEMYEHLGTLEELADIARRCRDEYDVNTCMFISVSCISEPSASKYGVHVPGNNNWTYHPELWPRFAPGYAYQFNAGHINTADQRWQEAIFQSCKKLADLGLPSICWDVYSASKTKPNVYTLTDRIKNYTQSVDPRATFAAESHLSLEKEAERIDYTWQWMHYLDQRPFANIFPAPRLNMCVNHSVLEVKQAFVDNLLINIITAESPHGINTSGWIDQYPAFSKVMAQCADRRRQFMDYFVNGIPVGACLFQTEQPALHASAYLLDDRALMIAMNLQPAAADFTCNLKPWIPSPDNAYHITSYDMDGNRLRSFNVTDGFWSATTPSTLQHDITLYEIETR